MDSIPSLNKKQLIRIAVATLVLIAIPITIYLVRQQQVFKSRALGEGSTFTVVGSQGGFTAGNPPSTTSQLVNLQLNFGSGGVSPTSVPTPTTTFSVPTSTPVPSIAPSGVSSAITFIASPSQVVPGENITLSWTGVNATDVNWVISPQTSYTVDPAGYMYLGTCSSLPASSPASIPATGSCTYIAPQTGIVYNIENNSYTLPFHLVHLISANGAWDYLNLKISSVTIINSPASPPLDAQPTPEPTQAPNCNIYGCCSVWNPLACFRL